MSKDTIYREDAIKAVKNVSENYTKEGDREWHPHVDFIIQALVEVPSIPSEDRPQGKWKAKSFHEYFCNNCGFSFDMMKCEFLENMKYCPNCGVRKGADDGVDDV